MVHPAGVVTFHPALYDKLPYDPIADFEPITLLASPGTWIVATPALGAKSLSELVALAKQQPGKLAYATVGGTIGYPYISSVLFRNTAGVDLTYVPYKGGNQAIPDLIGGRIHLMFDSVPTSLNHVRDGRLRALAFLGPKRHTQAPDVPTIAELGYPEVTGEGWNGMSGRKGMPAAVIKRLYSDVVAAVRSPDAAKRLESAGLQIILNSPEEFGAQIKAESAKWGRVIRENRIRGE
jgi:tripartite-type tricarboxylate transporter receptor subunit TctC